MKRCLLIVILGLLAVDVVALKAQQVSGSDMDPSLYLTLKDFEDRKAIAASEPWAKDALAKLLAEADSYPQAYLKRFGLTRVTAPEVGSQWVHWYVCPETGTQLEFHPPNHNICPDTGKDFQDWPINQVHYHFMHDMLEQNALALALAYRFTGKEKYAQSAAEILLLYADKYKDYPIIDNYGKQSAMGARIYSQTLNESIWLIDMTWVYDLVRGYSGITAAQRKHIEDDLLVPSAELVIRGHHEITLNIQSWINAAEASVGFELNRKDLIDDALNGPLGFRYQMKNYVRDGFWAEGAFGYQTYAMRPMVATALIAKQHGINLWKEEPALESMFTALLEVLLPNGYLPTFNDSHEVKLAPQADVYDVAFANTRNPHLLDLSETVPRTSKYSLLFGDRTLPKLKLNRPKSAVFPNAGLAMLRAKHSDLNIVMKFGDHGGGHGHYDKLGEVLFANGRLQGVDPGTQRYGLPLHFEWDQMSVAHNTLTADELRQEPTTGKLVAWEDKDEYTAVMASAGGAYEFADLSRAILVTDEYALQIDHAHAKDGKPHNFDFVYHNFGSQQMDLDTKPYDGFVRANGYQHLTSVERGETSGDVLSRFENAKTVLLLRVLADGRTEVFRGEGTGPDLREKVPFVIVRRRGTDAIFTELFIPCQPGFTSKITAESAEAGEVIVHGPGWTDSVLLDKTIRYRRSKTP